MTYDIVRPASPVTGITLHLTPTEFEDIHRMVEHGTANDRAVELTVPAGMDAQTEDRFGVRSRLRTIAKEANL